MVAALMSLEQGFVGLRPHVGAALVILSQIGEAV
jgi:hypothetical protein